MFSQIHNRKNRIVARGFSLLELIIVIAIASVVSIIILSSASRFDSSILLTNLAYKIALTLREAQSSSVNVKGFGVGSTATFNVGYGVHFYAENSNGSVNNTAYILFGDLLDSNGAGDLIYNGNENGGPEYVGKYITGRGNTIEKFCGVVAGNSEICSTNNGLSYLNIVFIRPNPDAVFKSDTGTPFRAVKIYVKAPDGSERQVKVESTGQISVCGSGPCS